ncbi:C45 family autoproteolytic acyltransferase/hydolase [Salirhabdus sp. Marseille-P4669]|uniref:C45 family autoproteolytic acyltransferase/hydolase n=1 Tax=Salirhabdus sp. Marseille-P4669 TaxID=2042310 RepID=UPI000C7E0129|nr:C45 family peptidase [Salirhabdus sp. Marseille-P4669]
MKSIYSNVIQFRGTHYNYGYKQGKELKDSLIIKNREKQWQVRKPRFSIDQAEAKDMITKWSPNLWDELLGLRDGLEWPLEKVLQNFGGYRIEQVRSGCTVLTGDDYFIRNYDFHPKTYEGRFTLYQPTDGGYATIGPSQRITGRPDGMNEKGLVLGYNFMHRKKPGDGFVSHTVSRMVLEYCANVEEAVAMLKEIPHRHSFSYIVFDPNGKTFVVEASSRGVAVRESNMCTNHFEIKKEENRNYLVESEQRLQRLKQSEEHVTGAKAAYRLLNDTGKGVFSKEYRNWAGTIHTSGYFPKTLTTWFALGGDQNPVEIDFKKWLTGEDIQFNRIEGEVDTDLPFAHMDEAARWFGMKSNK